MNLSTIPNQTNYTTAPLIVHESFLAERQDIKDSEALLPRAVVVTRQLLGIPSL